MHSVSPIAGLPDDVNVNGKGGKRNQGRQRYLYVRKRPSRRNSYTSQ